MEPGPSKRIEELFDAAVVLPRDERRAWLNAACPDDPALRAAVEELLKHDEGHPADFLEVPPIADVLPPAAELHPGDVIAGKYRIVRPVGQGAMGTVYEAEQDNPRRRVALKMIRPGYVSDELLRRFQREAHLLGRLHHPGIATIYEAGSTDTGNGAQPFFAMEFVDGPSIAAFANERNLTLRRRLELVVQVADAVQHAHDRGVIHRDLKPGNILIGTAETGSRSERTAADGGIGIAKILDFGVARAIDSDVQTVTLQTDLGQLLGTLPYMSPEQVAGDPAQIDARSDVYALGVIIHELLCGSLPLDVRGKSVAEAARIIRDEEPSRLSTTHPHLRGDLETIVSKAIAKEASRRYQSAAEMAADIQRHLHDEPIAARPPSTWYQLQKFTRRNKPLVAGVAATFAALVLGLIGTATFAVGEYRQRTLAEQREAEAVAARTAEREQREIAERRFNDVRELARTFIFDFYDAIADLQGSTAARELIVATGLRYLDSLATGVGDDPELLKELAAGYVRLGDVQGNASNANLGDTAGALESRQKGLEILRRLVASHPNHIDYTRSLTAALNGHASILFAMGRQDEAIASYNESLRIAKNLASAHPEDQEIAEDLATAHANLGRMQESVGRLDEALENYERYRDHIAPKATKESEADLRYRRNLATILLRIAIVRRARGDIDAALRDMEEVLRVHAETLDAAPDSARARSGLEQAHYIFGTMLSAADRNEEAIEQHLKALAIQEELAQADPADARIIRSIGMSHFGIGLAHEGEQRYEEALQAYERYRRQIDAAIERNPDYAVLQRDRAIALLRTGRMHMKIGRHDRALTLLERNLELSEALLAATPGDAAIRGDLASNYATTAECHSRLAEAASDPTEAASHRRAARSLLQKSLDLYDSMRAQGTLRPGVQTAISTVQHRLEEISKVLTDVAPSDQPE